MLESQLLALGIDGKWKEPLEETFAKYQINTNDRKACFIGQCMHESGGFKFLRENLNYSARALMATWPSRFPNPEIAAEYERQPEKIAENVYGGRMGNTEDGDGWKYIGRGLIQITGRANYVQVEKELGVRCVASPELLETPENACLTAAWFWNSRMLNDLADKRDFIKITKKINGGLNGIKDREELYDRALKVLL